MAAKIIARGTLQRDAGEYWIASRVAIESLNWLIREYVGFVITISIEEPEQETEDILHPVFKKEFLPA